MQIQRVAFGRLVLDGRTYTSDLVIYPDGRVREGWRRARGHRLSVENIAGLVERGPELIVAGTGINGRMRPDPDLEERLAACFHLTC